jgi:transcriptional regulator with XRE-family HTH domain
VPAGDSGVDYLGVIERMTGVGPVLREWRERRRLTQLALALDAQVSARHLSFVETGRSKPGREMLLRVLEQLELPFRERNRVLLAAGHAPAFPERSLEDPELAPVRKALDLVLSGHEPYPAFAIDRAWNLVAANSGLLAWTGAVELDPALLEPPVNAVRLFLHPRGAGPLIVDVDAWRAFFRDRLERQRAITGDDGLAALIEELTGYMGESRDDDPHLMDAAGGIAGPLTVRLPDGVELSLLGMFAGFDAPFEVTTSELAVELLFPADRATAEAFEGLARGA